VKVICFRIGICEEIGRRVSEWWRRWKIDEWMERFGWFPANLENFQK